MVYFKGKKERPRKEYGVVIYDKKSFKTIEQKLNLTYDDAYELFRKYKNDSRHGSTLIRMRENQPHKTLDDTYNTFKGKTTKL